MTRQEDDEKESEKALQRQSTVDTDHICSTVMNPETTKMSLRPSDLGEGERGVPERIPIEPHPNLPPTYGSHIFVSYGPEEFPVWVLPMSQ